MNDTLRKRAIREVASRNEQKEEARKALVAYQMRLNAKIAAVDNIWQTISESFGKHLYNMIDKAGQEIEWSVSKKENDFYVLLYVQSDTQESGRDALAKITVDLDSNGQVTYSYRDWMYHCKESYTPSREETCNFIIDTVVENLSDHSLAKILAK